MLMQYTINTITDLKEPFLENFIRGLQWSRKGTIIDSLQLIICYKISAAHLTTFLSLLQVHNIMKIVIRYYAFKAKEHVLIIPVIKILVTTVNRMF